MAFAITGRLAGAGLALARLQALEKNVRRVALRAGLTKAARVLARAAKGLAPVGASGLLKKSLGIKVSVKKGGAEATARVGPRRGLREQAGVRTRGRAKGSAWFRDPVRYAHLVELGTAGGRPPHRPSAAKPFLRPALASAGAEAARALSDAVQAAIRRAGVG